MADDAFAEQVRLRAGFLKEQGLDYGLARQVRAAGAMEAGNPGRPKAELRRPATVPPLPHAHSEGSAAPKGPWPEEPGRALDAIRAWIGDCRRCKLCEKRSHIVFGVGDPRARVMFIGEGPGADEDAQGEPFVGRAGKLLTDIITKGMGLSRSQVYIANVVKCRPPGNRDPEPDEVQACLPFLEAQIDVIRPEVIVGLGRVAIQALLKAPVQITKFRGTWTDFRGTAMMPTYHPSYLLRNPGAKGQVWKDIQEVMAKLGLSAPIKK
ncbi:MAG: uracil-DNA glycosylase [Acidobacteriota bacterium]